VLVQVMIAGAFPPAADPERLSVAEVVVAATGAMARVKGAVGAGVGAGVGGVGGGAPAAAYSV